MVCSNCGQETEEGKFCTNCGVQLSDDEAAVTSESPSIPLQQQSGSDQIRQETQNGSTEKLKNIGANFGHFFSTLIKRPSEAKNANGNDFISGIIIMVIYALLLALGTYLVFRAVIGQAGGVMGGPELSFFDTFLLPLLEFIILFLVVAGLTFAVCKLSEQSFGFTDVLGKYGAYLIPFLLLYVLGFFVGLLGIPTLAITFILLSMVGILMIAPTFILLEQPAKGFDRIYSLLALYFVAVLVCGLLLQSFAMTLIDSMMGSFMGGLGGF